MFIRAIITVIISALLVGAGFLWNLPAVETLSRKGSSGNEVTRIQLRLIATGYLSGKADGVYGDKTVSAVKWFQGANGLTADGVAGSSTLSKLGIKNTISRTLQSGSKGPDVALLQIKLREQGFLSGSIDEVYGSKTVTAVKKMQRAYKLTADGVAGPSTLKALKIYSGTSGGSGGTGGSTGGSTGGNTGGGSTKATSNERALLARIISAESRGEPYKGQVAVGAVIMNRIRHPSFPNTLSGVIYQRGAFTAIVDGQFNEAVADSAYRAADEALAGADPTGGCIYYYNPATATSKWIFSRPVMITIGKHRFCM